MTVSLKARFQFTLKQWFLRLQKGLMVAVGVGMLIFLMRWAGYRGKFESWGYPITFTEALSSFPITPFILIIVAYALWPRRHHDE